MLMNPYAVCSATYYRREVVLLGSLIIWFGLTGQARAQTHRENTASPQSWAWTQIKQGKPANFNVYCDTPALDPRAESDKRWNAECRQLPASFLVTILTRASWREQVPFAGVTIIGARIVGDIDLNNATLNRMLLIELCRIENGVNLAAARTDSGIGFIGSRVAGIFNAGLLQSELSVNLNYSEFEKPTLLSGMKTVGYLSMDAATFDEDVTANSLKIGGELSMRSINTYKAHFKGVDLLSATVAGNIDMIGASFDGDVNANGLRAGGILARSSEQNTTKFKSLNLVDAKVGGDVEMYGVKFDKGLNANGAVVDGNLLMRSTSQNTSSFKNLNLIDAKVGGDVDVVGATVDEGVTGNGLHIGGDLLIGSTQTKIATFGSTNLVGATVTGQVVGTGAVFTGDLIANGLQVGGSVLMSNAGFQRVTLTAARVAGQVNMTGATFDEDFNADSLSVGASVFVRGALAKKPINMALSRTGGNLDFRGATLAGLILSGASVAGDLSLGGGAGVEPAVSWRTSDGGPGSLTLSDAHVANLMDERDAWPIRGHLHLDGFTFDHLGGIEGDTGPEMRARGMKWWDDWARRDPVYSPTPYEQLAAALVAAGDRSAADDIRFLRHVRERETEKTWGPWMLAGVFQYVAGFGIGDYTFRVLYWVIGISFAGAVYLWNSVKLARARGTIWCFGASLSRLLPIIEINREFTDFFDDPKRVRLTGLQSFIFSAIRVVGWILGAILVAALSGLMQKS